MCRNNQCRSSVSKGVLRNFTKFTGKHLHQCLYLNKVDLNFFKKENLALVFSCDFCEISKDTFFTEYLWVTTSELVLKIMDGKLVCPSNWVTCNLSSNFLEITRNEHSFLRSFQLK